MHCYRPAAIPSPALLAKTPMSTAHSEIAPSVLSIIKSHEFRQAYHQAVDRDNIPLAVQETTARGIIEAYFGLEPIESASPLLADAVYFTAHGVAVHGHAKFLVPGAVDRHLVPGPLFRLTTKPAASSAAAPSSESPASLVQFKDFGRAISAVEAVRLTLIPERVNGIISFIADAKQHYASGEVDRAERSMSTAMDHFNRAAGEGLRRIQTEAERGKRGNELAGARRRLADLRHKLQHECDLAKPHLA